LLEEEFENPLSAGAPAPSLQTFYFREAVEVQFLRFDLDSYWGDIGGGLDYFDVLTVSELCQSIEMMDGCPPYDCGSPAPLIEKHPGVKCQCRHKCTEPASHATTAAATVLILIFLALAFLLIFLTKRRKQESKKPESTHLEDSNVGNESPQESSPANDEGSYLYVNTETEKEEALMPNHVSLHKDANLKERSKEASTQIENLEEEFLNLVKFVKENVKMEMTIATQGENKAHNRYTDIAPFDDNYISLKSEVFQSPEEVTYVNASRIVFTHCQQTFLAAQAPRPVSFCNFWHMVIQEEVSVIVMITKLVENNKRKAHQYWPEETGEDPLGLVLDIGGGCSVEFISTSYQGSYFLRTFSVWLPDGGVRKVIQLQTEDWPDLTAPEEPRVLLDLIHKTHDFQEVNRQSDKKSRHNFGALQCRSGKNWNLPGGVQALAGLHQSQRE